MGELTLFRMVWTAGVIFVVSLLSQSLSDSKKSIKEKISIAFVCSLFFTPLALGMIFVFGGDEW